MVKLGRYKRKKGSNHWFNLVCSRINDIEVGYKKCHLNDEEDDIITILFVPPKNREYDFWEVLLKGKRYKILGISYKYWETVYDYLGPAPDFFEEEIL